MAEKKKVVKKQVKKPVQSKEQEQKAYEFSIS